MKRAFAILILLVFLLLLILMLYFAFTGSKPEYLLAVLFCLIVVPTVAYVLIWITNLIRKK